MENLLIFVPIINYWLGAGIRTLMCISDELSPYICFREMEKTKAYEEKNGWKGVYFAPGLAFSVFEWNDESTFPYFLSWLDV